MVLNRSVLEPVAAKGDLKAMRLQLQPCFVPGGANKEMRDVVLLTLLLYLHLAWPSSRYLHRPSSCHDI